MPASYKTFTVTFEYVTPDSDTVRQSTRTVTVWGDSEFAIKRELERQNPGYQDVVLLETEGR